MNSSVKDRARSKARRAIRAGVLVPQPCEKCGAEPTDAHHEDYDKPLTVRWLCRRCHGDLHAHDEIRFLAHHHRYLLEKSRQTGLGIGDLVRRAIDAQTEIDGCGNGELPPLAQLRSNHAASATRNGEANTSQPRAARARRTKRRRAAVG